MLSVGGAPTRIPPFPAEPIDSTGAGDSFAGAFLAYWLETGDPELAVAESPVTAGPEVRKVAVPNLKARQALSTRSPRGPRHAVRANSDSGQGGSTPTRQRAAAGSAPGGDR